MPSNETLLLAALLLVAILVGYFSGRRSAGSTRSGGLNPDYFRGLNYLLNDQPDDALDVFVKMVEVDSDTIETHFALGSLFRRRGEVDRAIRIHQNLIARPNLSRANRTQALFALGEDYLKAGLFDRAESLFEELSRDRTHGKDALRHLSFIYEQQRDWEKAIRVARDLESVSGKYLSREIAHYHCELAELALANGDLKSTSRYLRKASAYDKDNVRVQLLMARVAELENRYRNAIKHFRKALETDPAQSAAYLSGLQALLQKEGRGDQFEALIESVAGRSPLTRKAIALSAIRADSVQSPAVEKCIKQFLDESEGLEGVRQAINRFIQLSRNQRDLQQQEMLRELLRHWKDETLTYLCSECGYSGKVLYWQCPSCRTWESLRPSLTLNVSAG